MVVEEEAAGARSVGEGAGARSVCRCNEPFRALSGLLLSQRFGWG